MALIFNVVVGPLAPLVSPMTSVVRADDVVITQDDNTNGCNGVVTTPGSENTDKRLIAGSLEPGGTATFEITYPVDPDDVAGREQFEITDCVFIGDEAVAKYFIHFVPNTENFILTFTLSIPSDAPVGDEYCNYAKTTAAPSESQASNRKAGPACFLIGGDLLINKVDGSGNPLAGASFDVDCDWPTSTATLANTVISAQPDGWVSDGNDANTTDDPSESFTSTSGGSLSVSAETGSGGTIAVAAPVGTVCTFTETSPPAGYQADPNDLSETLTVTSGQQQSHTFVNTLPPAHLTIVKDLTGEIPATAWAYTGDLGSFTLPAAGGSTSAYELQAGSYTVTETTKDGYDVSVSCDNGDSGTAAVTVDLDPGDDVTCTFYNVAQPGSITVIKSLDGVAPDAAWGYTGDLGAFTLPAAGGQTTFSELDSGTYNIAETTKDGYAVSVSCDSGETGTASVSVDLDPGEDVICTFVNVAQTGITIDKSNDAEVEGQPGPVSRGDTVHFTIDVEITNNDANNVIVTDTLPDGLTYVAGSADPSAGFSISGQELTWDAGDLAIGSYTFEYDATVDSDASGTLTNLACIDADELDAELCDDSSVEVTSPSMLIDKVNNAEAPVARGSIVSYTLTVTVSDGPINDAEVSDTLPAGLTYVVGSADPATGFSVTGQELTWTVASLSTGTHEFTYDAIVDDDAPIGATLVNTGCVTSEDDAEDGLICDDSEIEVKPSTIDFDKSSNHDGEFVLRGDTIDYTLTVTVTDGPIHNAVVTDELPDGLTYVDGSADPATGFDADGQDLTWTVGTLASGTYEFTYSATVDSDATGELPNLGCVDADETDALICDQTSVEVRVPTLVISKSASTETVLLLFDVAGNLKSVTPNPVTWTLTWSMTSGPVTNAVITDVIPDGLTYVAGSASNGGTFDAATSTLTWNLGTLTESIGSVTFQTTTDADAAIGTPIENVAVIDSNETAPDDGRDSITVSEQQEQGSTGTPKPSVPNTASVNGPHGQPVTIPIELLAVLFLASLGTLATANIRSVRRR
ncbi:MAG TPA: isopeptide-forming domain-containing fimbrial protein [Candidatus Limnocylindria bacterium]|nr:isopeptide-forming domain-containing fimbrial protein [Candidatus Limnocylindria bacterium]